MRRTREGKAETRATILTQASRLFRERGVESTSVGDVMAEAGLTHGGFYRHFDTKDALVAATIRATFEGIGEALGARGAEVGVQNAVQEYFAYYLSQEHVANPGMGCPVPALGADIARGSPALKAEFAAGFKDSLEVIAAGLPGSQEERREAATRELAMRVGAILIARACDPETASEILKACRAPHPADS